MQDLCQKPHSAGRGKSKPEGLAMLNDVLVGAANVQIPQQRWRDFCVLAVDGSTPRLPKTPAIAE